MRGWMIGVLAAVAGVVAVAILVVALLSSSGRTSIVDLEVGDCLDLPIGGDEVELDLVDLVDCDEPHQAEVVRVGSLNPDGDRAYPSDDVLFAEVERRCVDAPVAEPERFGLVPIAPDESSWDGFAGRFACLAVPFGGGSVTGSAIAGGA